MITLKKIIPAGLLFSGLILITAQSQADCFITSSGNVSMGTISSMTLTEQGTKSHQFSAGLRCDGFSLAFANMTYLKYRVNQIPDNYVNSLTGETLIVNYLDTNNQAISLGKEIDMSTFTLLKIFSGVDGSLPFYAEINPGQTVSPGRYTANKPFKVKWYYSVPSVAALGIGVFFESPAFWRGGLITAFNWGTGYDATLNLYIDVLPDCRITTNDVNFGTAPFADVFTPVQTSIGVRCSVYTPYHVGLNNGLYPQSGNQRAMKASNSNNFLHYEIYKNASTERWGSIGNERWSSLEATTNPGQHHTNQQGFAFTTKILDTNPVNLPAGNYSDTVTVNVEF
ncbi:spore coat U domain-containing protein [Acinetobacter sp. I-MWF]|uniref:Csu type fimbrial protein n=1 Tax=Acinetobacter sp. I-MWF TaxID=2940517 RepID=UPI0021C66DAE|nr:spore coat U domain-containing protein [Acinetobacter sp. I-MWF]MCT9977805.1 spore coat U domain-containing protein [Acinetobacter sp. I-MWF]